MKVFLSIIFFILIILFFPVPFKIKISISNNDIFIKFYNFTLFKKSFQEDKDNAMQNKTPEIEKTKKKKKKKSTSFKKLSFKSKMKFIPIIKENKFKPCLYLDGFFKYSLNDAAKTAVSFGIIHTYAPIITSVLSIVFKIKKFKFPITPIFKDSFIIISEINCIITISIAKTIYIGILLINNYIKIKGDELERENLWV